MFKSLKAAVAASALIVALPFAANAVTVTPISDSESATGTSSISSSLSGNTISVAWDGTDATASTVRAVYTFSADDNFFLNLRSFDGGGSSSPSRIRLFNGVAFSGPSAVDTLANAGSVGTLGTFSAGTYTFLFDESNVPNSGVAVLGITAVPLPAGAPLVISALAGFAMLRRRKAKA